MKMPLHTLYLPLGKLGIALCCASHSAPMESSNVSHQLIITDTSATNPSSFYSTFCKTTVCNSVDQERWLSHNSMAETRAMMHFNKHLYIYIYIYIYIQTWAAICGVSQRRQPDGHLPLPRAQPA